VPQHYFLKQIFLPGSVIFILYEQFIVCIRRRYEQVPVLRKKRIGIPFGVIIQLALFTGIRISKNADKYKMDQECEKSETEKNYFIRRSDTLRYFFLPA